MNTISLRIPSKLLRTKSKPFSVASLAVECDGRLSREEIETARSYAAAGYSKMEVAHFILEERN